MLKCNKMEVHTFLICIAFTIVLKMGAFDCQTFPNYFPMNLFAYQEYATFVLSPFSTRNLLGVAYLASNGETSDEMQYNIGLNVDKEAAALAIRSESIYTATEVFVNETLELAPEFRRLAVDVIKANITSTDLSDAQDDILNWIEYRAPNLNIFFFQGFTDANTTAVVVNAMNVTFEWRTPFTMGNTIDYMSMMHLVDNFLYGEIQKFNAKAVVLPFKNKFAKMLLLLPNSGYTDELILKLRNININSIISTLSLREVDIFLPNFTITENNVLDSTLKEMNVRQAFKKSANFKSLFNGGEESYIKAVKHSGSVVIGPERVLLQSTSILQLGLTSRYSEDEQTFQYSDPDDESEFIADVHFNSEPSVLLPEKLDSVPSFLAYKPFVYVIMNGDTVMGIGVIRPIIDIPAIPHGKPQIEALPIKL